MDAPLARAFLASLPDVPPDERSIERVRACLASLLGPDIRYLVATILGPRAPEVARVAASVLRAAGAPTGTLGATLDDLSIDGRPIDDGLLGKAGTMAASSAYQLAATSPQLGELTRREGTVVLGLVAFAEASQRVGLLLDPDLSAVDPVHAPRADLAVIAPGAGHARALTVVEGSTPLVVADREVEEPVTARGVPALVGGRDFAIRASGAELDLSIRGEHYVSCAHPVGVDSDDLATGIATALALGAMGIRMREEWIINGVRALDGALITS